MGTLHYIAESAFDELLTCWRSHNDEQRRDKRSVTRLNRSRAELDLARDRMNRLRVVMYPTPDELAETLLTTLCPTLDQVVHLGWRHRDPANPGHLACFCGQLVPI
ncbi:MAG: hypothetical protein V3V01_05140 [Acidimicrobiales bacterium]